MQVTDLIIPVAVGLILIYALFKKVDIWSEFLDGAKENIKVTFEVMPALIALMLSIGMFRASGAIDYLTKALSPLIAWTGFPEGCIPLGLIRPLSGSGATATFENILNIFPPDSYTGRVASVMLGSSETTFYTATVYFSVTKVRKLRHAIPCALVGDITGPFICAFLVGIML
jgi:spore maturation protein B